MSPTNAIVIEREGHVVALALNRPDAVNDLDGVTHEALNAALKSDTEMKPLPRVLMITDAGSAAFAGGFEPSELLTDGLEAGKYTTAVDRRSAGRSSWVVALSACTTTNVVPGARRFVREFHQDGRCRTDAGRSKLHCGEGAMASQEHGGEAKVERWLRDVEGLRAR